jgi:hypothetical protein
MSLPRTRHQWGVRWLGRLGSPSATQAAILVALLAVVAGAFFAVRPPEAYGICMACHGRDLVNWTLNSALGTGLTVAPASAVFPLLTGVGVVLGALLAALASGEFRWSRPEHPLKGFVYGVLVMNFALLAAGCSIRLLLRAAAGDLTGLAGVGGLAAGIFLATSWLSWRACQ